MAPSVNRKRAYYDLIITAPKTVSITAFLRPNHPTARAVLDAHVTTFETKCSKNSSTSSNPRAHGHPSISQWIAVSFHHTHTHENAPHLHTHLVLPNVGKNTQGEWRAIQIKIGGCYRQRLELRYGHELARQFRHRGWKGRLRCETRSAGELES